MGGFDVVVSTLILINKLICAGPG